ncbi:MULTISPECIES: cytochrome b/b6 domain-containing protein [unclassified Bradyrhizobium]|uniref:cytochrome b n=1 Tax=unclassified Bradyrhizobium TaxID=2631580 RepID=UPI002478B4D2|nr:MULTISPECIES: cytochrome b/b6 domain-containing protein [unclassified Bradyrhizobium]WGR73783.1 cytochrome b/b6 domain-containing protein [Bradyrhizobium sp. ISRA426]WGR78621.1 cytochrome b/b6 domain-containing protein [Bradyrhizobium sp. ISRA430]WGR89022.1 cytochrome b/b6 domain-containing protein [Bradyrhizobium sp. ISRA432]
MSYGATAKVFHWTVVVLLAVQYLIAWLMPDVGSGRPPGAAMALHASFGILLLVLTLLRLAWRWTHPVTLDSSLTPWERLASKAVHWLLYTLVFAATLSGWMLASLRGWSVSFFYLVRLPMLCPTTATAEAIVELHQASELALLVMIGLHVGAAFAHAVIRRDGVMQRMLP